MNFKDLFDKIKSEYCQLVGFKLRGNTMELLTNICTKGNQYVSVFISHSGSNFIISDGGWIDLDYYGDLDRDDKEDEIVQRIEIQLRDQFDVRQVRDEHGILFNYKVASDPSLVSMVTFELANYVAHIANSRITNYLEEKLPSDRKQFVAEVNHFLRGQFIGDIQFNDKLQSSKEEISNVRFSAIVRRPAQTTLLMYVTGSTHRNFVRSTSEAIVNFRITQKETAFSKFTRAAIINSQATGYNPHRLNEYFQELTHETTVPIVDFHNEKEMIRGIVLAA